MVEIGCQKTASIPVMAVIVNTGASLASTMAPRRTLSRVLLASLLVLAVVTTGSGVALATQPAAQSSPQDSGTVLNSIEQLLQNVDEFLETVLDLLRTIRAISGEGAEGG